MTKAIPCIILLVYLHIESTMCAVRVQSSAHLNLSFTSTVIHGVRVANSGGTVYVSMTDTDSIVKIKMYSILSGSFSLQKTFIETAPRTIVPNEIVLYSSYVIGLQTTALNFTAFLNTNAFIGRYTVN